MFLMKTFLKRKSRDFRVLVLVNIKIFVSDKLNIYFLVQYGGFNRLFHENLSARHLSYVKYLINISCSYSIIMCLVICFEFCIGSLSVTPLSAWNVLRYRFKPKLYYRVPIKSVQRCLQLYKGKNSQSYPENVRVGIKLFLSNLYRETLKPYT